VLGLVKRPNQSTVASHQQTRASQADILYTVKWLNEDAFAHVLVEHKSTVDKWTLLQRLRYMMRIWERNLASQDPPDALSPIIPIIVHHSETGWTAPTHFGHLSQHRLESVPFCSSSATFRWSPPMSSPANSSNKSNGSSRKGTTS
jgi:hypothetical protein